MLYILHIPIFSHSILRMRILLRQEPVVQNKLTVSSMVRCIRPWHELRQKVNIQETRKGGIRSSIVRKRAVGVINEGLDHWNLSIDRIAVDVATRVKQPDDSIDLFRPVAALVDASDMATTHPLERLLTKRMTFPTSSFSARIST